MDQFLSDVLVHPSSELQLRAIAKSPSHALLFEGQVGVGLKTVAQSFARSIAGAPASVEIVSPDEKGTIGIARIQSLYHSVKIKHSERHVTIIDDVDAMTTEAQNAFLKMLEEPPRQHVFLLTSHHSEKLLPTITSRLQSFTIRPVASSETDKIIFSEAILDNKSAQLRFLAAGLPAELYRLLNDEKYFSDQVALMTDARKFLEGSSYERLSYIGKMTNDRVVCDKFLTMVATLSQYTFDRKPNTSQIDTMEAINDCLMAIRQNGNIKLQMARLGLFIG
jgi:replication-associated recombination protein RarA